MFPTIVNHSPGRDDRKISQATEDQIIKICEIAGGFFFAILAAREIFSENAIVKQIKNLKVDLKILEGEVTDLFKIVYNNGKDAIRRFPLNI